jgi:hypothetical protein
MAVETDEKTGNPLVVVGKPLFRMGGRLKHALKKRCLNHSKLLFNNLPEIFARGNRTSTLWGMRCITDGNGKD